MATDLGKAYVQIIPSADGISGEIENVLNGSMSSIGQDAGKNLGNSIGSGLSVAAKGIGAAVGVAAAGVTAMSTALTKGVSDLALYGDEIDKESQKLGISAEAYQEWEAVLQHSGTSMSSMTSSFKTLANAMAGPTDEQLMAFENLGIGAEIYSMTTEDAFSLVVSKLQDMDDGARRTAIAQDLLGRGAMELGALFNTSAEDTQAMKDRVHELGGVLSTESVKAAAAFQDSLQDMQTAMAGITRGALADFLPAFTQVIDGLTALFSGDSGGIAQISQGLAGVATKITEHIPQIVSAAAQIATSLAPVVGEAAGQLIAALTDVLPQMTEAAGKLMIQIVNALVEAAPALTQAAVEMVATLASGLGESLPQLIPAIVGAVAMIVETLLSADNLNMLLDAGLQLIMGLAEGLLNAVPDLIEALPDIIDGIVTFLGDAVPQIVEAGITLLMGIVDAIPDIVSALVEALPKIVQSIVDFYKNNYPQILEACITLLYAIIDAIPDIITALVEAIPEISKTIIDTLIEAVPELVKTGFTLLISLIKELPQILKELVAAAGQILESLGKAFLEGVEYFADIGKNLVEGLWNGLQNAWTWLKEKVHDLVEGLVSGVKKILQISSPSKVFAEIGGYMAEGMGVGFDKEFPSVQRDIEKSLDFSGRRLSASVYASAAEGYGMGGGDTYNITIPASSVREFNDIVKLAQNQRRLGRMVTA